MIARSMQAQEFDITINLLEYYRDELEKTDPRTAEQWDVNSVIATVRKYAAHTNTCWFNLYEGQRPVGCISGCFVACPWNKELVNANIDLVFVIKSHRSYDAVNTLVAKFEEWAKQVDINKITITDTGFEGELTDYYTHLGYSQDKWMTKEI